MIIKNMETKTKPIIKIIRSQNKIDFLKYNILNIVDDSILFNEEITINDLQKLLPYLNDDDFTTLIQYIKNITRTDLYELETIYNDEYLKEILDDLIDMYGMVTIANNIHDLMPFFSNPNFKKINCNLKYVIDKRNVEINIYIAFIKYILSNINVNEIIFSNLNEYYRLFKTIFLYQNKEILLDEKEINNFENSRNKLFNSLIDNEEMFLDQLTLSLFNEKYLDLKENLNNILSKSKYLNGKQINTIKNIAKLYECKTNDDFKKVCYSMKDKFSIYLEIKDIVLKECAKDISVHLNYINEERLNGEPFNLIVHKLTSYNNFEMGKKLSSDIKEWNNNHNINSVVSTSLISNINLGMIPGDVPILGFSNIDAKMIVDMGPSDLDSYEYIYKYGLTSPLSKPLFANELLTNTKGLYNEIVLQRYYNNTNLMPDYIVSLNQVSYRDKKIAKYFGISNLLIDQKIYLEKMEQKIIFDIETKKFLSLGSDLFNQFASCNDNEYFLKKYYEDKIIEDKLGTIISNIDSSDELKLIIDIFYAINYAKLGYGLKTNLDFKKYYKKI